MLHLQRQGRSQQNVKALLVNGREIGKDQKELFRKKAGALLIELGYENSLNW